MYNIVLESAIRLYIAYYSMLKEAVKVIEHDDNCHNGHICM